MEHYGTLRNYRLSGQSIDDIRDSKIYSVNDDKLGKIDDVIFDHATGDIRYVVVDTGGWLSSKRFIVPADRLRSSSQHENDYEVSLTKQQIESFPPYDENAVESQVKWTDYESRYRASWRQIPAQTTGTSPNLGRRWTSFEDRLRGDRDVIVSSCSVCSRVPAQASERERQRKVS